jgi:peptidylprolyl isomerase
MAQTQKTLSLQLKSGRVVIELRPDLAPKHVERVTQLAQEGFYNNCPFHRVIEGFMAQTGDGSNHNGTGGSQYPDLQQEFSAEPHVRGTVSMARAQSVDSANSQFFICYDDTPHLNNQYTVFGKVISGMEHIDRLTKGTSTSGVVNNPDLIEEASASETAVA